MTESTRQSAGLLMYRFVAGRLQVLLAHPGGPFFRNKDAGAWTIPKGKVEAGETLLETAQREFREEIGVTTVGPFVPLTSIRQKGGKRVHAWAVAGDFDTAKLHSQTFEMEWPPKSGRLQVFPEVDRATFFDIDTARTKMMAAQIPLIDELIEYLSRETGFGEFATPEDATPPAEPPVD